MEKKAVTARGSRRCIHLCGELYLAVPPCAVVLAGREPGPSIRWPLYRQGSGFAHNPTLAAAVGRP